MALRARQFEEARRLATSNLELAWWLFMRVSGVLLVFLVLGHLFTRAVVFDFHHDLNYAHMVKVMNNPLWKFYNWLLLFLAMLHGTNGARYVIEDHIANARVRAWVKVILYSVVFIVLVFGTVALWGYNYRPLE